jgi:hypothetical protein
VLQNPSVKAVTGRVCALLRYAELQVAEGAYNVVQEVPVRVLTAVEASRFQDPTVPEPMVRPYPALQNFMAPVCTVSSVYSACLLIIVSVVAMSCIACNARAFPLPAPLRTTCCHTLSARGSRCVLLQARLSMPAPKAMQAVVDRMKSLGAKIVRVDANAVASELALSVSSDCVALKSTFRGLSAASMSDAAEEDGENPVTAQACVALSTAPPTPHPPHLRCHRSCSC